MSAGSRYNGFAVPHTVAVAALGIGFLYGGLSGAFLVAALAVLEVAVSFDNAVVNATVLNRMDARWQWIFLTAGLAVAAIGMRLVVPVGIVAVSSGLPPWQAAALAWTVPARYAGDLSAARPAISAFGGVFLGLLFLEFLAGVHDRTWVRWLERSAARLDRYRSGVPLLVAVFVAAAMTTRPEGAGYRVALGAALGLALFLVIRWVGGAFGVDPGRKAQRSGLFLFCYLELLDATFSVDSVMGAFSMTFDIVVITLGLAVGAAYVRALTVLVVRRGVLRELPYLEHGAYYAIGVLAVLLAVQVWRDIPDVLAASASAIVLGAAVWSSLRARGFGSAGAVGPT